VGTFNFSAKYLSKKDSSTMLPELTEFVPATRMGIVRKVFLGTGAWGMDFVSSSPLFSTSSDWLNYWFDT
jgi:hypothetical protein